MSHGWGKGNRRGTDVSASTKAFVLMRDGYVCQIKWDEHCDVVSDEVDHIKTKASGGSDNPSNLRAACSYCNAKRNYSIRGKAKNTRRPGRRSPGIIY